MLNSPVERSSLYIMVRILQIIIVSALISTIATVICCIYNLLQVTPNLEGIPETCIIERFIQTRVHSEISSNVATHPLVREADTFALYLNPPKLNKSSEVTVSNSSKQTISGVRAIKLSPKFTLVATSYYRSKPQESMALVWEPGIGFHWIKQGTKLGHFIIDKIEHGTILYRNGNWRGEMVVDTKMPTHTRKTHQTTSVSTQTSISPSRSPISTKREIETNELGSPNREAQSIAEENEIGGVG